MNNIDKKSALIFSKLLNNARKNGIDKGMHEEKMFVKEVVCGKGLLMKKLNIMGRSKMGIIRVPKCSVRIVLEEKSPKEYYKMIMKGDCPTGQAHIFKQMLHQSDVDFDRVQKMSHMTTSKGRYYRRTQFKRLV